MNHSQFMQSIRHSSKLAPRDKATLSQGPYIRVVESDGSINLIPTFLFKHHVQALFEKGIQYLQPKKIPIPTTPADRLSSDFDLEFEKNSF